MKTKRKGIMRLKRKFRIALAAILLVVLILATVFAVDIVRYNSFIKAYSDTFTLEINGKAIEPTTVLGEDFIFHEVKNDSIEVQVPKNSVINLEGDYKLFDENNNELADISYLRDGKYTLEVTKKDYTYVYKLNVDNDFSVNINDQYAYSAGYLEVVFDDLNEDEKIDISASFETSDKFNFNEETVLVPINYHTEPGEYTISFTTDKSTVKQTINVKNYTYRESRFNVDESVISSAAKEADPDVKAAYDAANLLITDNHYYLESGFHSASTGVTTGDFGDIRFINGATTPTRIHYGIDYADVLNTKIYSTAKGEVVFVGFMPAYGHTIVVDHGNGFTSHYFHMESTMVEVGDIVDNSVQIGAMGTTGYSTGVHLHLEIHLNGVIVNPYFFIN